MPDWLRPGDVAFTAASAMLGSLIGSALGAAAEKRWRTGRSLADLGGTIGGALGIIFGVVLNRL